jgi:hypothetical protein
MKRYWTTSFGKLKKTYGVWTQVVGHKLKEATTTTWIAPTFPSLQLKIKIKKIMNYIQKRFYYT